MGVYESVDYGAVWQEKIKGFKVASVGDISTHNSIIFGTSFTPSGIDGITKSPNSGNDWRWVYINHDWEPTAIEIAKSNTNIAYVSYYGDGGHIIKTENGGSHWNIDEFSQGITDLSLSHTNPDTVYASSSIFGIGPPIVFFTYDGGITWGNYSFAMIHRTQKKILEITKTILFSRISKGRFFGL